jgi:hypothetical protein
MKISIRRFLKGTAGLGLAVAASTFWIMNKSSEDIKN